MTGSPAKLTASRARQLWLHAQRLDSTTPFGAGPAATPLAVRHLGYVQIDTIHVIERCHHHILFSRIPDYRREHLHQAQSLDKTVFEYWGHALAYLPTVDFQYFVRDMRQYAPRPHPHWPPVEAQDVRKMLARIRRSGPLTIRDIDNEELLQRVDRWSSLKPSKRVLQRAFNEGRLTISARAGMLKSYELTTRHFGWRRLPPAASVTATGSYVLDRALRSQGVVSVESACYMNAASKPLVRRLIQARVRRGELVPVELDGAARLPHWARPEALAESVRIAPEQVHILSPFDPLIIQRKRLELFFGYQHLFEAYVPRPKRKFGYFACPVLLGERIVAALDLKTEREKHKLLVQKWTWVGPGKARLHKRPIEEALHRFELFQLAAPSPLPPPELSR